MEAKITRWGNSLGVRVPASLATQAGLKAGTTVRLVAEGRTIKMVAEARPRRYTLAELLAGVTKNNTPPHVSTGPDVGKEVIE